VQATDESGDCRGKTWRSPAGWGHQNQCEAERQQTWQISFAILNQTKGNLGIPGGVVVSGTAYDLLKSNVEAEYVPLGEKRLKNIATPVRVYQVVDKGKSSRSGLNKLRALSVVVAAIAVVVTASIAWTYWQSLGSGSEIAVTLPASENPSIVVLPLDNLSGDAAQDYFADGLTEDITTDLSQLPQLFVISHNTAFTYADQQVDPRVVSKELGVRYVLEGSVRRVGDTLRINMQLLDGKCVFRGHPVTDSDFIRSVIPEYPVTCFIQ